MKKKFKSPGPQRIINPKKTWESQLYVNNLMKNGLVGKIEEVYLYCNEKNKNRGNFLVKCAPGCEHYPNKKVQKRLKKLIGLEKQL